MQLIAGLCGNQIEADGSSKPPIFSKAVPEGKNVRLAEYNFLLDSLKAKPDTSLPLIFDVSDSVYNSWFTKIAQSAGITEMHIDELASDERLIPQVERGPENSSIF